MRLLNTETIRDWIAKEDRWIGSHSCTDDFLGAGVLYYALTYMFKTKLAVCLGSGAGFVPKVMRTAQRDLGMDKESRTVLIDANKTGWGDPDYHGDPTFFTKNFDVEIYKETTAEAVKRFGSEQIGYLHIDADHAYEGVKFDFYAYKPLVIRGTGFITLHDTIPTITGVGKLIAELKQRNDIEVMDVPSGMGVAVVRVK